jgi:8-oxo-dGTP diphosphatase
MVTKVIPKPVVGAIFRKNNKVLIARRANVIGLSGYWEFPGGRVEEGETYQEALKREMKEEFNLDVTVGQFISSNHHIYSKGEIILKVYEVEIIAGEFNLTVHDKIEWVNISELENYKLAPADIPIIKDIK